MRAETPPAALLTWRQTPALPETLQVICKRNRWLGSSREEWGYTGQQVKCQICIGRSGRRHLKGGRRTMCARSAFPSMRAEWERELVVELAKFERLKEEADVTGLRWQIGWRRQVGVIGSSLALGTLIWFWLPQEPDLCFENLCLYFSSPLSLPAISAKLIFLVYLFFHLFPVEVTPLHADALGGSSETGFLCIRLWANTSSDVTEQH